MTSSCYSGNTRDDARLGRFKFDSVYLGAEWSTPPFFQLFIGDGKDNIYQRLIYKLHLHLKLCSLNCNSVLEGCNSQTIFSRQIPGAELCRPLPETFRLPPLPRPLPLS